MQDAFCASASCFAEYQSAGPFPHVANHVVEAIAVAGNAVTGDVRPVARVDRMLGRGEDERGGLEHVRQRTGIVLWVGQNLGEGDVAGGADQFAKSAVGQRRAVDREAVDGDAMDRCFFRVMLVRSHAQCIAGNPDHVRIGRCLRHRTLGSCHCYVTLNLLL